MRRWSELAVTTALALAAPCVRAQEGGGGESIFARLGLDKLQLSGVGVSVGPVYPAKTASTQAYSVHADYGELGRHVRVVFVVTYWDSHFRQGVVDEFASRLRTSIIDPSGDDTVRIGRVRVSDIAIETDLRWSPYRRTVLRPYVGGGIGAHVINAENRFIANTFVESALDQITTGITAVAGADVVPIGGVAVGVQGRYTLLSTVRFATLRLTASYQFKLPKPRRGS